MTQIVYRSIVFSNRRTLSSRKTSKKKTQMSTWIEDFVAEINGVDLSLPLLRNKALDKDEEILGELDEYLQKLYRLREKRRETAEGFRDKIEDVKSVHTTEISLGISTPQKRTEHIPKLKIFSITSRRYFNLI